MEANDSEVSWQGMAVAKLCRTVSGWSFEECIAQVRQDRESVNAAFVHELGRAHGVNVLIFQEHADEALVGEDMMENAGDETDHPIMVPIALVKNRPFKGPRSTYMKMA